jgi:hypothetical protein
MKAAHVLLLIVARQALAFVPTLPCQHHRNALIDSIRRPQRHVVHLRFPRVPLLNRILKRNEGSSGTAIVLDEPVMDAPNSAVIEVGNATLAATDEKELSETDKLLKQVKDAGLAGVISYAAWELGFWAVSLPVVLFGYYEVTGHWPDLSDKEDVAKLGAEAFAFVNFARFAVPLRIGLALSTTPWIQTNIVDRFLTKDKDTTAINGSSE